MTIDYESLVSYFNYAILAMLVFGAIFGFFKGMFKSVYNLIVFVGLLLIGWFLSPLFIGSILNIDLSMLNLEFGGVKLTTLNNFINEMLMNNIEVFSGALEEGSLMADFLAGSVFMVLRIVVLILWLILMGTLFKFFFWIVYLIIKPKRTSAGEKRKKSILSRFGGMGVSLVHTMIIILIISIPLAGFSSIGSSLAVLTQDNENVEELSLVKVVYTNNGVLLADEDEMLEDTIKFMENYRTTYAGRIGGLVKLKDNYFDEIIFDEIFALKTNGQKVKLRFELKTAVKIYSTLMAEIEDADLTIENIAKIDKDVLDGIIEDLSKLKLIHVAIPIGVEFAVNSEVFKDELGDVSDLVDLEELLEALVEIDFEQEIKSLGKAMVAAIKLYSELDVVGEDEEINFLSLDPDKVIEVTNNLSESEILGILSDIALAYIINTEDLKKMLAEFNKTPEDVNLDGVTIGDELKSLGNIYSTLISIGFTSTDLQELKLDEITDEDIVSLGNAVYSSKFFTNNSFILASILFNSLPDDYKDVFVLNAFEKQDFVSMLALGVILARSGIMDDSFEPLDLLNEDNIEKIADYISKSNLLSDNIEGLLELLLSGMDLPIEIELPEDFNWKGEEGKNELIALFTAAEKILLITKDEDFNFTKENIDALSDAITESQILMANVGNLLEYFIDQTDIASDFDFTIPEDIEWDSDEGRSEFKALLSAVGIIFDSGLMDEIDFANLSDGTVDTNEDGKIDDQDDNIIKDLAQAMSDSRIIRENLTNIMNQSLPNDFDLVLFDDPDDWTFTELDSLFRSAKILLGQGDAFDIDTILELDESDIDIIVSSRIIVDNAVKKLEEFTKAEDDTPAGSLHGILFLPEKDIEYYGVNGELKRFILAAKIIVSENTSGDQGFEDLQTISLGSITNENQDTILESLIMTETIIANIEKISNDSEVVKIHPDFDRSKVTYVDGTWEAELPKLLDGVKIFVGEDGNIDNVDFDADLILNLSDEDIDTVTDSKILAYSFVSFLEEENSKPDSYLSLPNELNPEHVEYNEDLWYSDETEDGELVKALRALRELGIADFKANIDLSKLYSEAKGETEEVILASRVVEATIINKIESEATTGALNGILIIPSNVVWEKTIDAGVEVDKGELRRLLVSIEILLDGKPFEEAEFKVETLFNTVEEPNRQDTLLESKVVEASIINKIETEMEFGGSLEGKLVKPTGFEEEDWYGENGELRNFLAAIEVLLDGNSFETADFAVESFFGEDQDTLLKSRLVEASVVKTIDNEMGVGGSLEGKLVTPTDFTEFDWYGETGELRRFLNSIELIIGPNGKFDEATFDVDTILGDHQEEILESLVVEASVIHHIESDSRLITPSDESTYYYLSDEEIIWEKTPGDIGELRRFLNGVKALIGTNDFSSFSFTMDNMLNADFTSILESRVLEATIGDTINNLLSDEDKIGRFIIEPVEHDGYQWYYHETSTNIVRNGQYQMTPTTYQRTDLHGFIQAIQAMDAAGLNFNSVDLDTIKATPNTEELADAFWDNSRVIRGSLEFMLNKVLTEAGYPELFGDGFMQIKITDKAQLITGLNIMKTYV